MESNLAVVWVIVGMALVTYGTRIGGLWIMNRIPLTPRVEACLKVLPGTILMSLVAPGAFTTSPAETLASLATVVIAWRTRNMILAMVVGVGSVWMFRTFL